MEEHDFTAFLAASVHRMSLKTQLNIPHDAALILDRSDRMKISQLPGFSE